MRKELAGILIFFLFIFTLASLLSYSPHDPSIHHAGAKGEIHNLFGWVGAHLSGLLIGMFGLGAFWFPVILLLSTYHIFSTNRERSYIYIAVGGTILIITSGSILNHFSIFGKQFSSGGIVGIPIKSFLVQYTSPVGANTILLLLLLTGFILCTGFSLIAFFKRSRQLTIDIFERVKTLVIKWKERVKKAKKSHVSEIKQTKEKAQEIKIKAPRPKPAKSIPAPKQEVFEFMRADNDYCLPSVKLLKDPEKRPVAIDDENLRMQSMMLEKKLEDFGVYGRVSAVSPGPVITTFEYKPAPGVKINKIVNLTDDLALALRAISIRIVAPIPGKAAIGIEIPNETREFVRFKEIVISSAFEKSKSKLTLCLGYDIVGEPVAVQLDKMPHLLIAGATGAGKSVGLNVMISSLLYKATPDDVRMIMVDPKRIELSMYDGIPHLITPVVTDMKKATNALFWAVKEMEKRYELLADAKVRNITQYNKKIEQENKGADPKKDLEKDAPKKLPYIVIIIDELADLMMVASRDVEVALTRLAQMARASGIHIVLATQRPSVDVLTGIIKANFPTRISFQVSSRTDSRTILDSNGAENLLGSGDMLLLPPGTAKLQRIHGAYISEDELARVIEFWKQQQTPEYDEKVIQAPVEEKGSGEKEDHDEKYDEAVALVTKSGQASISMVQRHLRIGYNRAARIIEVMENEGVVGPSDGVKPREVLARGYDGMP